MLNRQVIDPTLSKLYKQSLVQALLTEKIEINEDLINSVLKSYLREFAYSGTCFSIMLSTYKAMNKIASPRPEEITSEMSRQASLLNEKNKKPPVVNDEKKENLEVKDVIEVKEVKEVKERKENTLQPRRLSPLEARVKAAFERYPKTNLMSLQEEKAFMKELKELLILLEAEYGKLSLEKNKKRKNPELNSQKLSHKASFEWSVSHLMELISAYKEHMSNDVFPAPAPTVSLTPKELLEVEIKGLASQFNTLANEQGTHSYFLNETIKNPTTLAIIRTVQEQMDVLFDLAETKLAWLANDKAGVPISSNDKENYQAIFKQAKAEWSKNTIAWSAQLFKKDPLVISASVKAVFSLCDKLGIERQHQFKASNN